MKNLHSLLQRFFLLVFLCSFLLSIASPPLFAWENVETHPAINTHAIARFEKEIRKKTPLLATTRLTGKECYGIAWDPRDGTSFSQQNIAVKRKKSLRQWIIDGGFSADEPEAPMGLRHFYNPTKPDEPWLTDAHGVGKFLTSGKLPEIDAVTWAIDANDEGDSGNGGQDIISIKQDYSWYDAKKYFRRALASEFAGDTDKNLDYGRTWRALGEVMHLMADMTVPAHVRNDGHALFEPLEKNTNKDIVDACAGMPACRSLKYDTGIEPLMRSLATWTNRNFFSEDTIPLPGRAKTANGQPKLPLPTLGGHHKRGNYIYYNIDGRDGFRLVQLVHSKLILCVCGYDRPEYHVCYDPLRWYHKLTYRVPSYAEMPYPVIKSQQSILIPTAIRACAQVLNRFLPRFEIKAEVSSPEGADDAARYRIRGEVKQYFHKTCWQKKDGKLKIRNGVYLMINGKAEKLPKRLAGGDFNEFSYDFSARPGDTIWLRYDLGGYVVESNKVSLGRWHLVTPKFKTSSKCRKTSQPGDKYFGWACSHKKMKIKDGLVYEFAGQATPEKVSTLIKWQDVVYGKNGRKNVDMTLELIRQWSPRPFPRTLKPGSVMTISEKVSFVLRPELKKSYKPRYMPKIIALMETEVDGVRLLPDKDDDPHAFTNISIAYYNAGENIPERKIKWTVPEGTPGKKMEISFMARDSAKAGLGHGGGEKLDHLQSAGITIVYEYR